MFRNLIKLLCIVSVTQNWYYLFTGQLNSGSLLCTVTLIAGTMIWLDKGDPNAK